MSVTFPSLSSVGFSCVRLSATSPDSCCESCCVPVSSAWIAVLRFCSSVSSRLPSLITRCSCALRSDRVFDTWLVLASKVCRSASREDTVLAREDKPFSVSFRYCGLSLRLSDNALKLSASCFVSMSPTVVDSWSNASCSWNGVRVRACGMVASSSWVPSPLVSSARYFSPRSVLISIDAVVASPTRTPLTRNRTSTCLPSSVTEDTVPTLTPAISTSLSGASPADSPK